MGSKKDKAKKMFSKSGRKSQLEGMYNKEKKGRKWFYCACFGVALLISLIFGAIHAASAARVGTFNEGMKIR